MHYFQRKVTTALALWLSDLNIEVEYIRYFNDVGFRILSDFLHMSANECVELFEFLKVRKSFYLLGIELNGYEYHHRWAI